ncbi:MAG: alanine racemase [Turicibacter sp.]|nr:alanine racemase [Turicibacter sp.]
MSYYRDTYAAIDLDAISYNVSQIIKLHPSKTIFAVVKANGYGHGDYEVAKAAIEAGAGFLAVSALDEALSLRQQGLDHPILVLGMTRLRDVFQAAKYGISLTAHDWEWTKSLLILDLETPLKVHLKIDTGMHRLGMTSRGEIVTAFTALSNHPMIETEGIYTHMSTADSDLSYLDDQVQSFKMLLSELDVSKVSYIHLENTAAILQFDFKFDQGIRLGLGMYGLNPDPGFIDLDFQLKPALSLYSHLTQVKFIEKGSKVGYGATYVAPEGHWLGVIPIGYADGWIRDHQGRSVIVNGMECEIIGRVCMDQMMVRLPQKVPMGTRVELIGKQMPAERVARELGTIPYEVLCLISDRVPRVYFRNNELIGIRKMRFDQL